MGKLVNYDTDLNLGGDILDNDIDITVYFARNAPEQFAKPLVNRASRQMRRAGTETMRVLCGMTDEEIIGTRNIGIMCQEIVFLMRDKYAAENQINLADNVPIQ